VTKFLDDRPLYIATYPLWLKIWAVAIAAFFWWMLLIEGYLFAWSRQGLAGLFWAFVASSFAVTVIPETCVQRVLFLPTVVRRRSKLGITDEFSYREIVLRVDPYRRWIDLHRSSGKRIGRVWGMQADLTQVRHLMKRRGARIKTAEPLAQLKS
jgi:hypothetical protein